MSWPKRMEIVEVEWIDSCGNAAWRSVEHDDEEITDLSCKTVGYLFKRTKDRVVVALNQSATGNVGDTIAIPRSAVRRMSVLKKK